MTLFRKYFGWMLPEDSEPGCGYGPFKLSEKHPFTRACNLHDWEFGQSHNGTPDKSIDQVDWDIFYRWVLIAKAEENLDRRIELVWDIIKLWPLARVGGNLLWEGDPIEDGKIKEVQTKLVYSLADSPVRSEREDVIELPTTKHSSSE